QSGNRSRVDWPKAPSSSSQYRESSRDSQIRRCLGSESAPPKCTLSRPLLVQQTAIRRIVRRVRSQQFACVFEILSLSYPPPPMQFVVEITPTIQEPPIFS